LERGGNWGAVLVRFRSVPIAAIGSADRPFAALLPVGSPWRLRPAIPILPQVSRAATVPAINLAAGRFDAGQEIDQH
jgi:hypothetical protein